MNEQQRIDYARHFLDAELNTGPNQVEIGCIEDPDEWTKLVDKLRETGDAPFADPSLVSRQGILYPVQSNGRFQLFVCPRLFALYPREEDADVFLLVWITRIRSFILLFNDFPTQRARERGVTEYLRNMGLPDELIEFPSY